MTWWMTMIATGAEIVRIAIEGASGRKTEAEARAECLALGYKIAPGTFDAELAEHEKDAVTGSIAAAVLGASPR